MKKTLKNSGAPATKDGIDHLAKFRETPAHLIKRSSVEDLKKRVLEARSQKLKKAS